MHVEHLGISFVPDSTTLPLSEGGELRPDTDSDGHSFHDPSASFGRIVDRPTLLPLVSPSLSGGSSDVSSSTIPLARSTRRHCSSLKYSSRTGPYLPSRHRVSCAEGHLSTSTTRHPLRETDENPQEGHIAEYWLFRL